MNIPGPLLDRMEVIRLPGYTEDEKLAIARRYLVPKQLKANGFKDDELSFSDEALLELIRYYSREAGVRELERQIAKVCRKVLRQRLEQESKEGARRPITCRRRTSSLMLACVATAMVWPIRRTRSAA